MRFELHATPSFSRVSSQLLFYCKRFSDHPHNMLRSSIAAFLHALHRRLRVFFVCCGCGDLSSVAAELKALQLLISSVSVDGDTVFSSPPMASPHRARASVHVGAAAPAAAAMTGLGDTHGSPLSPAREPRPLPMGRGPEFAGMPDVGGDVKLDYE